MRSQRLRLEPMFCVRGHRDHRSDSLRPLRRHLLVVRPQQGKALGLPWGEAETGVFLLRQAAAIKLINNSHSCNVTHTPLGSTAPNSFVPQGLVCSAPLGCTFPPRFWYSAYMASMP